jgi:hypothetical protein
MHKRIQSFFYWEIKYFIDIEKLLWLYFDKNLYLLTEMW